ncbi:MAG: DUF1700 domain-containing protein [Ruminococcus sp.]|nr:DUF1700 domain-containing protein [Ruminococcus sp.]
MNKQEFLSALTERLSGLPAEDIERYRELYSESIDDRMEEGFSEEEAVADLGVLDDIARQIIKETPMTKLVKEKFKTKRELRGWQIALIVIGSPLWIAVGAVCFSLLLTLFILLWVAVLVIYVLFLTFCACSLALLLATVFAAVKGSAPPALLCFGSALFCIGLSILLFFGAIGTTKGVIKLCGKILLGIKTLFVGKEKTQ